MTRILKAEAPHLPALWSVGAQPQGACSKAQTTFYPDQCEKAHSSSREGQSANAGGLGLPTPALKSTSLVSVAYKLSSGPSSLLQEPLGKSSLLL